MRPATKTHSLCQYVCRYYDAAIKLGPKSAFSYQNRGASKQALGDIDGALSDINEAIRIDPALPQPLTNRTAIWRAKGDNRPRHRRYHRSDPAGQSQGACKHHDAARQRADFGLHPAGLAHEARGDFDRAKQDYNSTLEGVASDAVSKANQATAKVRLSLLSEAEQPRIAPSSTSAPTQTATSSPPSSAAPGAGTQNRENNPMQSSPSGRRVALVIGNGAYVHVTALPNPSNDARSIAKSLRDIGFAVTEGINLDRGGMQTMIRPQQSDGAAKWPRGRTGVSRQARVQRRPPRSEPALRSAPAR